MPVKSYLKDKQKKIESKYHQVTRKLEFNYGSFQEQINSRFHREQIQLELERNKLNRLFQNFIASAESKIEIQVNEPALLKSSTHNIDNFRHENIDWTRGRFSGRAVQIILRNGQIIEKVFITPKGNRISVKRSELGLLARLRLKT